jgi:hypothetical protein
MDCMWPVGPVRFRFDQGGKLIEAWRTMTNQYGEYCGRDIIWLEYWRNDATEAQSDRNG